MKGKFVFLTMGFAISFQALAEEPIPTGMRALNSPPSAAPITIAKNRKKDRAPEGLDRIATRRALLQTRSPQINSPSGKIPKITNEAQLASTAPATQ